MKSAVLFISLFVSAFVFSSYSFAGQVASLPAAQQCMSKHHPVGSKADLNSQFGINLTGGEGNYIETGVATAASRLKALGKPQFMNGMNVEMHPGGKSFGSKCSSFAAGTKHIHVVASCPMGGGMRNANSTGIALNVLHEVGHTVGQSGFYKSYHSPSIPVCRISSYCTHGKSGPHKNRNEEFAEVFASFVHSPNTLKSVCPDAYAFMAKNVFQTEGTANICNGIPASNIAALPSQNPSDNVPMYPSSQNNLGVDQQTANMDMSQALSYLQGFNDQNAVADHGDDTETIDHRFIPKRKPASQCNANSNSCGKR